MIDLKLKHLSSEDIHSFLKAMYAIRRNWDIAQRILDNSIEASETDHETAHNAKDVEGILKEIEG